MRQLATLMLIIAGMVMCFIGMRTCSEKESRNFWLAMYVVELVHTTLYVFKNFY